jgi:hypothetical protein
MSEAFSDTPPAFLSTGAVAHLLGLKPDQVRAKVDSGALPRPQLMSMGRRTERVYSQEWVVLADDAENTNRLEGLESWLPPDDVSQFAIRIDQTGWTLPDAIKRLNAINNLWHACMAALEVDPSEVPELDVRRVSAGSPLDLLLWIGGPASVGVWLMRTAINSPEKLVGLIPRTIAGWHNSKADAADAKSRRVISEQHLEAIRAAARGVVGGSEDTPVRAVISGPAVQRAEIEARAVELEIEAESNAESGPDVSDS